MNQAACRILSTVITAGGITLGSAAARGAVFFSENFESYTAVAGTAGDNDDNDPTNPGDGNPANWSVTENIPNPTPPPSSIPDPSRVQVTAGTSTGGSGTNQQVLHVQGADNGFNQIERGFTQQTDSIAVSFKIRFNTSVGFNPTNAVIVLGLGNDTDSDIVRLEMRPEDNEGPNAGLRLLGIGDSVVIISDVFEDDWYQIDLEIDLVGATTTVTATNLDVDLGLNPDQANTETLNVLNGDPSGGLDEISFFTTGGATGARLIDSSIDDILIVPEPATTGLIALGLSMILPNRRNSR